NTDARVFHLQVEHVGALGPRADPDLTAIVRELERVRNVVVEDLFQTCRIERDPVDGALDVDLDANSFRRGHAPHHGDDLSDEAGKTHVLSAKLELPRLHLCE